MAYKLDLPAISSVHPVFHVSQLKVAITAPGQVSAEIPETPAAFQYPLKILKRRRHRHNNTVIDQILVQWSMWPAHLATWEDEQALKLIFPAAPAWGQAGSQGGVDVRDPTAVIKPTEDEQGELAGSSEVRRRQEAVSSSPGPASKMKTVKETVSSRHGPVAEMKPTRARKPNPGYFGSDCVA